MKSWGQIICDSFKSTSHKPRWWILSLIQVSAFSILGEFARPVYIWAPLLFLLLCCVIVLTVVTAVLWLDIEGSKMQGYKSLEQKFFVERCLAAAKIVLFSLLLNMLVRFFFPVWILLTIVSSLITATAVLAMLYVVLCGQSFKASISLAMDTWNKKVSFAASAAFLFILAHGISFGLVHGVWPGLGLLNGFSVFNHSATIWLLSVLLMCLIAFLAAVLNTFLVLLFLDIIRRDKEPEVAESLTEGLNVSQVDPVL